jgi:decaprenyl-phosphate phosphoribosyltransferase
MKKILAVIKLLRVHQWTKNAFIFLPAFFGHHFDSRQQIINCVTAFLGFSLVASSVYIFNDYLDIEVDQAHPTKKERPLASGTIGKPLAISLMLIFLAIGLGVVFPLGWYAFGLVLFYVVQNFAYCVKLKDYPIVDVVIISVGFVLRILIGGAVTHTILSHWIILITFLLALFLALAKRRDDVLIAIEGKKATRKNTYGYNLEFLNSAYTIMASVVIVAYVMYTVESNTVAHTSDKLFLSSFFVIIGMLRYLQITMVYNRSGSPTMVLIKDRFLQIIIVGWVVTVFVLLYVKPAFLNG